MAAFGMHIWSHRRGSSVECALCLNGEILSSGYIDGFCLLGKLGVSFLANGIAESRACGHGKLCSVGIGCLEVVWSCMENSFFWMEVHHRNSPHCRARCCHSRTY